MYILLDEREKSQYRFSDGEKKYIWKAAVKYMELITVTNGYFHYNIYYNIVTNIVVLIIKAAAMIPSMFLKGQSS